MDDTVDVVIPLDAEAAKVLPSPARREAVGRYLSDLLLPLHAAPPAGGDRGRDPRPRKRHRAHAGLGDRECGPTLNNGQFALIASHASTQLKRLRFGH
jgi:hypothetical protein